MAVPVAVITGSTTCKLDTTAAVPVGIVTPTGANLTALNEVSATAVKAGGAIRINAVLTTELPNPNDPTPPNVLASKTKALALPLDSILKSESALDSLTTTPPAPSMAKIPVDVDTVVASLNWKAPVA